jgi:hypothetical protein
MFTLQCRDNPDTARLAALGLFTVSLGRRREGKNWSLYRSNFWKVTNAPNEQLQPPVNEL